MEVNGVVLGGRGRRVCYGWEVEMGRQAVGASGVGNGAGGSVGRSGNDGCGSGVEL